MFRIITAMVFLASSITFAYAEGTYAKVYGGLASISVDDVTVNGNKRSATSSDASETYGVALGVQKSERYSFEVAIDYYNTEYKVGNDITVETENYILFANGYHHLNENFYLGGGIGLTSDDTTATSNNGQSLETSGSESGLTIQGVLGFQMPITETMDWDSNLRYVAFENAGITSVTTGLRFKF